MTLICQRCKQKTAVSNHYRPRKTYFDTSEVDINELNAEFMLKGSIQEIKFNSVVERDLFAVKLAEVLTGITILSYISKPNVLEYKNENIDSTLTLTIKK